MDLETEPAPGRSPRTWIGAGIGAAAIAAAAVVGVHTIGSGTSTAAAASRTGAAGAFGRPVGDDRAPRPGAVGTIAGIRGDTITVSEPMRGATTTVHATAATVVHTATAGTIADVHTGDVVLVQGDRIVDRGASSATAGRGPRGGTNGTVTSVGADSITITTASGTTTVPVGSATAVEVTRTSSLSDLHVGDQVRVEGTSAADGSITATAIDAGGLPMGAPPDRPPR